MDLLLLCGRLRQGCGVLAYAYYLRRMSQRLLIVYYYPWEGVLDEEILTALGHLPEYPTCSKAMCWYGIRCTMNFVGPIKPSLQYGSTPCSGLLFLYNWVGRLMGVVLLVRTRGFDKAGLS